MWIKLMVIYNCFVICSYNAFIKIIETNVLFSNLIYLAVIQ